MTNEDRAREWLRERNIDNRRSVASLTALLDAAQASSTRLARFEAFGEALDVIAAGNADAAVYSEVRELRNAAKPTPAPAARTAADERACITKWLRTLDPDGVYPLNCADMIDKGWHAGEHPQQADGWTSCDGKVHAPKPAHATAAPPPKESPWTMSHGHLVDEVIERRKVVTEHDANGFFSRIIAEQDATITALRAVAEAAEAYVGLVDGPDDFISLAEEQALIDLRTALAALKGGER